MSTPQKQYDKATSVKRYRSTFSVKPQIRRDQNLRTVTAKQIMEATMHQGQLVVSNSILYTVQVCGRITSIDQEDGRTYFKIDDGTGQLEATIWSHQQDGQTQLTGAVLGAYYHVVANVKRSNGRIFLHTVKARKVDDYNDITIHMLTAINEHCQLLELRNEDFNYWKMQEKEGQDYQRNELNTELDKEAIIILLSEQRIRDSETGASTQQIMQQCLLDEHTTRITLELMLNEGSIYTTTGDHYKMADNN